MGSGNSPFFTMDRAFTALRRLMAVLKPVVASPLFSRMPRSCLGVRSAFWVSKRAATPAACGEAIEVPSCVL
ncbi:hypothetical protein D3C78_1822690 [compost metagenome]